MHMYVTHFSGKTKFIFLSIARPSVVNTCELFLSDRIPLTFSVVCDRWRERIAIKWPYKGGESVQQLQRQDCGASDLSFVTEWFIRFDRVNDANLWKFRKTTYFSCLVHASFLDQFLNRETERIISLQRKGTSHGASGRSISEVIKRR